MENGKAPRLRRPPSGVSSQRGEMERTQGGLQVRAWYPAQPGLGGTFSPVSPETPSQGVARRAGGTCGLGFGDSFLFPELFY